MSQPIDYVYAEYIETLRVAATEHTCDACKDPILVGHRYYSIECVITEADDPDEEDEVEEHTRCRRCQKIHEHLRTLAPGDMWPDEQLDCGEEYKEHWGKEPPPEIAELAFKSGADLQGEP
jgi:hypothetical protein